MLDASCLLNLYATGRFSEMAIVQPFGLAVADYVIQNEALYVRAPASEGEERIAVDLSSVVRERLIQVLTLRGGKESELFVDLAVEMDDGEAISGAIALSRGHGIATDDRKARRVLTQRHSTVQLVSTLEIVKNWSEQASIAGPDLRQALQAMEAGANYVPGERDPLYGWWSSVYSAD